MIRYIIRRVLWAVLVLLIVVFITYMIFFLLPSGDPAVRLAGKNITPRLLDQIRLQFGLDHPWYIQYLLFLKHAFLGDQYGWPGLGLSFTSKVPLKGIIFSRIAVTAQLALGAAIVWLVVGISIGILSALRPRSLEDRTAMGLAVLGISMPVFFLGPIALYIFWFKLHWLPGTGYYPLGQYGFGTWFSHWILPWAVLAVLYAAFYARLSRSNLMETLGEDYIRTARAKGLTEKHHGDDLQPAGDRAAHRAGGGWPGPQHHRGHHARRRDVRRRGEPHRGHLLRGPGSARSVHMTGAARA